MWVSMYSLGSPATTPPLASTASWLTMAAVGVYTTPARNQPAGSFSVTSKVKSSTTFVSFTMSVNRDAPPSARSISITRSHEYFTSSAVNSVPSWKVTPSRIGNVYVSPSSDTRPFSWVGTSVARLGTNSVPSTGRATSVSYTWMIACPPRPPGSARAGSSESGSPPCAWIRTPGFLTSLVVPAPSPPSPPPSSSGVAAPVHAVARMRMRQTHAREPCSGRCTERWSIAMEPSLLIRAFEGVVADRRDRMPRSRRGASQCSFDSTSKHLRVLTSSFVGMTGRSRVDGCCRPRVHGRDAAVDVCRAVVGIGMGVDADPSHLRALEVTELGRFLGAFELVVGAADAETDPIPRGHHDRGRPDLHVELDRLAGDERLDLVVGVPRPPWLGPLPVELAVRCPQPSLSDRRVWIDGALQHDLGAVRIEHAQDQEQVRVGRRGRDEQRGRDRSGDLGLGLERGGQHRDARVLQRREARRRSPAGAARPGVPRLRGPDASWSTRFAGSATHPRTDR